MLHYSKYVFEIFYVDLNVLLQRRTGMDDLTVEWLHYNIVRHPLGRLLGADHLYNCYEFLYITDDVSS